MTLEEHEEAQTILAELQRIEDELEFLRVEGDAQSERKVSPIELQARLKALKEDIKLAAKYETLSRRKHEPTELESCFFGSAMQHASAAFRMPTNTNPYTHKWWSGLSDVHFEIVYYRDRLVRFLESESTTS